MFRPSIRNKLLYTAVLAVAPAFLLLVYVSYEQRQRLKLDAEQRAMDTVHQVANHARRRIDSARGFLEGLSALPILDRDHSSRCTALFRRLMEANSDYANIGVIDGNGRLFCSAVPFIMDTDLSDRAYFRKAQQTGAFAIGDYIVGRVTRKSSINMGVPLPSADGELPRVLYVALDLGRFGDWVASAGLPSGFTFTILDREGTMLARYPLVPEWIGKSYRDSDIARAKYGRNSGTAAATGLDGVRRIYAFGLMGDVPELEDIQVLVGIPEKEVYGPIDEFFRRSMATMSLVALLAFLGAWAIGDKLIVRRLSRLVRSVEKMGEGVLSERTGLADGKDEISALAGAVDRMAESLEQLTGQTRLILQSANEGICRLDPEGRIMFANPSCSAILGVEPESLVSCRFMEFLVMGSGKHSSDDIGRLKGLIGRGLTPVRLMQRGGASIPAEMTVSEIYGSGGSSGFLVIFADVSSRRKLEDQLNQAKRMEAVGRLAGGVAHDFNNLLTLINGNAQIIQSEAPADSQIRHDITEIVEASQQAAAITRQLLLFSRHQVDETRTIDLTELLSRTIKLVRRMIGQHIRTEIALAPDLRPVKANAGQIEQVVMNLALNAADAMKIGGVLTVSAGNLDLADGAPPPVDGMAPDRYVELKLSDTGVGMSPEVLSHVFEPFYTTKEIGKGTGLGLSVVYGIVKSLSGHIRIDSAESRGTTVTIYFPATDEVARPARADFQIVKGTGETIMVVEDDPRVRSVTVRLLNRLGYKVIDAPSGDRALEMLEATGGKVDLLFSDMLMPGMDGNALCAEVRKRHPRIRTVVISGYAGELYDGNKLPPHIDAFLSKPYNVTELATKLATILKENRP